MVDAWADCVATRTVITVFAVNVALAYGVLGCILFPYFSCLYIPFFGYSFSGDRLFLQAWYGRYGDVIASGSPWG